MKNIIEIKNLNSSYEDKKVLNNLSLEIENNSITSIVGPNGSGKTTLLKHLIKELKTKTNTIFIDGKDITSYKQIDLSRKVSFVSQNYVVKEDFKVSEFVDLGRYCHNDIQNNKAMLDYALELTNITYLKDKLVSKLSGGELQLVMLCRAICQDADIILLDEVLNNLDPKHQIQVFDILKTLQSKGKTIICVLHDLNAALNYCENTVILNDGKVFKAGKSKDVLNEDTIRSVYQTENQIINLSDGRCLLTFCCSL